MVDRGVSSAGTTVEIYYWCERGREVDFVVRLGKRVVAIEVKSGASKGTLPGMEAFARAFRPQRKILVGGDGLPLQQNTTSAGSQHLRVVPQFSGPDVSVTFAFASPINLWGA